MTEKDVKRELVNLANPTKAKSLQRYFKTARGEYAAGDRFLGISVPAQRKVALKYRELSLREIGKLLGSGIHEHRFTALNILTLKYKKASEKEKDKIANFYLKNTKHINNWDLVDTSAPYILGEWLLNKDKSMLCALAKSKNVWERRIAIVSTYPFIKNGDFKYTIRLAKTISSDKHDLIHKATGWMLREVGKKSQMSLEKFLLQNCAKLPRTTLRYAIERFPKSKRKDYLNRF
jgi:3-methyladenine DNA glycosylase AlkD